MFTPLALFIGQRYTHSQRRNRFISFISFASMLGIILGVMVLITILSVMNGLEKELRARILGVVAHVTVSGTDGKLADWQSLQSRLAADKQLSGAAPYIKKQVMLTQGDKLRGVQVQGVLPDYQNQVSDPTLTFLEGGYADLTARGYGIILGAGLADALQVLPGDKVTLVVPQVRVTPAGVLPRVRRFTVLGLYDSGVPEFDSMNAFVHMDDAARLFSLDQAVTGIRLRLDDLFAAQGLAQRLQQDLGADYTVEDWSKEHGGFFRAVKTEKIAMAIILFMVIAVALFNLWASLAMAVNEKEADIAILRTLGLSPKRITRIFMVQGVIIGSIGTLLGVILGVLLSLNIEVIIAFLENTFGFKVFPADLFYISDVPSELHWRDVWIVGLAAFGASILATRSPARRAALIQPAESLRYE